MGSERRTTRRNVNQYARILLSNGSMASFCTMMDVSAGGAKLRLNDTIEMPQEFILVLSRSGAVRRRCRMVWQRGDVIGVRFITKVAQPVQSDAS